MIHELKERGVRLVAADQEGRSPGLGGGSERAYRRCGRQRGERPVGCDQRRCDMLVRFPMAGRVASLNAASAGALLLFEVVRQRNVPHD